MTLSLIYDRTAADVQRVKDLAKIGWSNMTADEQDEWLYGSGGYEPLLDSNGDPILDSNGDQIMVLGGTPTIKGAYNYTDLNRVENAVITLASEMQDHLDTLSAYLAAHNVAPDALFDLGYTVPALTTKTDWDNSDFFTGADAARYLGNIAALRDLIPLVEPPTLPTDMDALTFEKANAIEKLLFVIEEQAAAMLASYLILIDNTYPNFIYCNEVYCGEV